LFGLFGKFVAVFRHFAYFFSFDLYTLQYRAETEMCRLKDGSQIQVKKNAQHQKAIELSID